LKIVVWWRLQIWLKNVPHTGLVSNKKDQNWVKQEEDKFIFPGGGTQFKTGALHYIEFIQEMVPSIAWGKHTRVVLDVGCGVASFGGYLFDKDVITMSFAPKDEHEAQVQFALERGIPAFSAVMGTQRLVFPSNAFDAVHCASCRVSWHAEGGILLVELNRVLRPGGFFIWSATPVYSSSDEDKKIWTDTLTIVQRLSWSLLVKRQDPQTGVGVVVFQKPEDNELYDLREVLEPPYCEEDDKPDAAWYVPMKACIHRIPTGEGARSKWPREWPLRVEFAPSWLTGSKKGIYGSPAVQDYESDTAHWMHVIQKSYLEGVGLNWSTIRNVMDMKAGYGGYILSYASHFLSLLS
jgi:SAM-dependent methyltransferase